MKRFPELVKIKADAVLMRKKAFFMGLLAIITVCFLDHLNNVFFSKILVLKQV